MEQSSSRTRIRRSKAQWQEIMARFEMSGQTQTAFCASEGIAIQTFHNWRARLKTQRAPNTLLRDFIPMAGGGSGDHCSQSRWEAEFTLPNGIQICFRGE